MLRKTKKADITVFVITHILGWSLRKPVIMEFHFFLFLVVSLLSFFSIRMRSGSYGVEKKTTQQFWHVILALS